jgi:hypothetical protein
MDYAHLPRFYYQMVAEHSPTVLTLLELCGAFALPRISSATFHALAEQLNLHPAGLLRLRDQSLLSWPEDEPFFVLHQLIHEYAASRLQRTHLRLYFLPTYSPRLNPIERVWRHCRRNVTDNVYFGTLPKLMLAVNASRIELARSPAVILSIVA